MCSNLFKMISINYFFLNLALDNLQMLICSKIQPINLITYIQQIMKMFDSRHCFQ